jgi:hypothetical protein
MVYNMLTNYANKLEENIQILNANAPEFALSDRKGKNAEVGRLRQATQWFVRVLLGQEKATYFGQEYSFHDYLRVCLVLSVLVFAAQIASAPLFVAGTVLAVLISSVARQKIAGFFARYVCRFDQLPRFVQTVASALQTLAQRIGLMSVLGITAANGGLGAKGMTTLAGSSREDATASGELGGYSHASELGHDSQTTAGRQSSYATAQGKAELKEDDHVSTTTNGSVKSPTLFQKAVRLLSPLRSGERPTSPSGSQDVDYYEDVEGGYDQGDRLHTTAYGTPKRDASVPVSAASASEKTPADGTWTSRPALDDEACTPSDASGAGPKEQSDDVAGAYQPENGSSPNSSLSASSGSQKN